MFTGIVEEIGTVKTIVKETKSLELAIACSDILDDIHLGDSISVNGVCLTVTKFDTHSFHTDVMPETFNATSLAQLKTGSEVNLERAMAANGRFGGHFVSGHVDSTGLIKSKKQIENALYISIEIPTDLMKYMMNRGSVTVDGTSLTLFNVADSTITISLIPHTQDVTILAKKQVGEKVNIESDLLAKYVENMFSKRKQTNENKKGLTSEKLSEYGFINS